MHETHRLDEYLFGKTRVNDHMLISVEPNGDWQIEGKDLLVYCIDIKSQDAFDDCLANARTLDAVLAFLEVKSIKPEMSMMERDIIFYWGQRCDEIRSGRGKM